MATTTVTDTGLATTTAQSQELVPTAGAAEKQYEIQSAITVAKRFPRSEDMAFQRLMRACDRSSFAEDALYSFPRGGATVEGPSVNLAREAARVWGNLRYGQEVIRDDEDSRLIRAFGFDLESNVRVSAEDEFNKLVQRKGRSGGVQWVKPDERDLRELTNRRGAILVRNCLLQLLPKDLIEDAMVRCKETLKKGVDVDPDGARKKLILAFATLGITAAMLEAKLGHALGVISPAELTELRTIYKSVADGNSNWADYLPKPEAVEKATVDPATVTAAAEPNRGHGQEELFTIPKKPRLTPKDFGPPDDREPGEEG